MIIIFSFLLFHSAIAQIPEFPSFWPLPDHFSLGNEILLSSNFALVVSPRSAVSTVLTEALIRYMKIINIDDGSSGPWPANHVHLPRVSVTVAKNVPLTSKIDEEYSLDIPSNGNEGKLTANTQWGALRGLETLAQMIRTGQGKMSARSGKVMDKPRFGFRGFLVDTARHFLTLKVLKQHIDALSYNKFNVMHWHLVDDQAFPFVSTTYPELAKKGAYSPSHTFSPKDVAEIIEYGYMRGVLVMPEFDSPGHVQSWGKGYPDLLTICYDKHGKPNGKTGPLNPVKNTTYTFVRNLYKEIASRFDSDVIHMGGDEVSPTCWASNPQVKAFMKQKGWTKFSQVETYYVDHVLDELKHLGRTPICWEEVFDNGAKITPETIVDVWKGGYNDTLAKVTAAGYRAILSAPWYLNYISYGADWIKYYNIEPTNFTGTATQKKLVIGGEACMWGEFVDNVNAISRTWPRASAIGERLWSPEHVRNITDAENRIHGHRCRMLTRGITAEPPIGPSWCPLVS